MIKLGFEYGSLVIPKPTFVISFLLGKEKP